jgi:hypothetical protein
MTLPVPAGRRLFPPQETVTVKALACDRPTAAGGRPLSRFSVEDIRLRAEERGISMSYSTVWRLLDRQGQPLGTRDLVLAADEMTGIQALSRLHHGLGATPGRKAYREFEYARHGTLCYLAFLDVFTGKVYGETSEGNGILPFEQALGRCLEFPRFQQAERIFLIVDNGCAHHPSTSPARIQAQHPQVTVVHLPTHSSWLNQVEIYFSILQRKALTPRDFPSKAALEQRLLWYQWYYNQYAEPFHWKYSVADLEKYLEKLARYEPLYAAARAAQAADDPRSSDFSYTLTN